MRYRLCVICSIQRCMLLKAVMISLFIWFGASLRPLNNLIFWIFFQAQLHHAFERLWLFLERSCLEFRKIDPDTATFSIFKGLLCDSVSLWLISFHTRQIHRGLLFLKSLLRSCTKYNAFLIFHALFLLRRCCDCRIFFATIYSTSLMLFALFSCFEVAEMLLCFLVFKMRLMLCIKCWVRCCLLGSSGLGSLFVWFKDNQKIELLFQV